MHFYRHCGGVCSSELQQAAGGKVLDVRMGSNAATSSQYSISLLVTYITTIYLWFTHSASILFYCPKIIGNGERIGRFQVFHYMFIINKRVFS